MLNILNNKIQSQWAFFGPKWFCWLLVLIGFDIWIIEGTLKFLEQRDYGPVFILMERTAFAYQNKEYFLMLLLTPILSFIVLCFFIYFPSFMFLFSRTFIEYYNFKGTKVVYLYLIILLSPIWYLLILGV